MNHVSFNELKTFSQLLRKRGALSDRSQIDPILESIIGAPIEDVSLLGGMTNKNYLVKTKNKHYVVRAPGEGTHTLINREHEKHHTYAAADIGVDIPPEFFCERTGVKITPFIRDAETLSQKTIPKNIDICLSTLIQLHRSGVSFEHEFCIKSEINSYYERIHNKDKYANLAVVMQDFMQVLARYQRLSFTLRPCHNDLVAENFIKSNDRIFLIDWEYAALNDPMWDIASMCLENAFSNALTADVLTKYLGRQATEIEQERLNCCCIFQDLLWSLWSLVKYESGEGYLEYGLERYERLKARLSKTL